MGIIGRTPIYEARPAIGEPGSTYWGLFSTVIDFPRLIRATGLDAAQSELRVALRGMDGLGSRGEAFWGEN